MRINNLITDFDPPTVVASGYHDGAEVLKPSSSSRSEKKEKWKVLFVMTLNKGGYHDNVAKFYNPSLSYISILKYPPAVRPRRL